MSEKLRPFLIIFKKKNRPDDYKKYPLMLNCYLQMMHWMEKVTSFQKYSWRCRTTYYYKKIKIERDFRFIYYKTHFAFNDATYIQTDGVSMGPRFGPVQADVFMIELEKLLVPQLTTYMQYCGRNHLLYNKRTFRVHFIGF